MAIDRSENMRRIRSVDTKPELIVRKLLRKCGFVGYRLHRSDLPGRPDIAFIGRRKAIFVHGCFWHGHDCPEGARKPKTNQAYWVPKIQSTRRRDSEHLAEFVRRGWKVLILWECELSDETSVVERLRSFMENDD